METKHINHVVLYAKNFYRHTGDIIKDMQRFMQMDGHKWHSIDTAEKVEKVMKADYLKWVDSLEDGNSKEYLSSKAGDRVMWADGPAGSIWSILISYSNSYIPMDSDHLEGPKYDKYHMPQFQLSSAYSPALFRKSMSFDEMNKAAKDFLDIKLEDKMDDYMNMLMDSFNFEGAYNIFKAIGDNTINSIDDIKDEMWNAYEDFMTQHVHEDGNVDNGYYSVKTPHFALSISTSHNSPDIHVEAILHKHTHTYTGSGNVYEDMQTLWNIMLDDEDSIAQSCEIAKMVNRLGEYEFYEHATDVYKCKECHAEMLNTIKEHTLCKNEWSDEDPNSTTWGTGGHSYKISRNPETNEYSVEVRLEGLFACVAAEAELYNVNRIMGLPKF